MFITDEDRLYNALALIPISDKKQLKAGDRVRVAYVGYIDNKKVEMIIDGSIIRDVYNCVKLDDTAVRKYTSGELKNFKKGFDGKPGVGVSWGIDTNGRSTSAKIIGKIA